MSEPLLPMTLTSDQVDLIGEALEQFARGRKFKTLRQEVKTSLAQPVYLWGVLDPADGATRRLCVQAFRQGNEGYLYFVPQNRALSSDPPAWHKDVDRIQRFPVDALAIPSWALFGADGETKSGGWVAERVADDARRLTDLIQALSDRAGCAWYGWENYEPLPSQSRMPVHKPGLSP